MTTSHDVQRHRGHRGGIIPTHRALVRLELRAIDVVLSVVVVATALTAWIWAWPWVARGWAGAARFLFEVLAVPAQVSVVRRELLGAIGLDVPRFDVAAGAPSTLQWWLGLIVVAVALVVAALLPHRFRPLAQLLRLLSAVQISSQLVFALFPGAFPYDVGGMTETLLLASLFVIGLVPLIMGFAYNPLAFDWSRRIAATVIPMLHLILTVPLLYVAHAWVLHHGSLLWMPLLFWAFGLVLSVFAIVAFYGWAVSWPTRGPVMPRPRRRRQRASELLAVLALICVSVPARSQEVVQSVQAGADYGRYTEDLGSAESAFVAYTWERPRRDRVRVDLGWASRFDDSGVGIGASYGFQLTPNGMLSTGLSTGTGDVILPDLRFDIGWRQTGLLANRLLVDVGYTRIESKGPNHSDGVGAGALLGIGGGFSVGVDGRIDIGQPGDTQGHTMAASLLYGIYRKLYLSARAETGRVAYLLVGQDDSLVEFDSSGLRLGATWYIRPDRGVGIEYSLLDTEVYDQWNVGLRAFREW